MEPMSGIEPPTYGLRNRCSTTELHWLKLFNLNHLIQQQPWRYRHAATRFYHKPSEIYYGLAKRSGKQFRVLGYFEIGRFKVSMKLGSPYETKYRLLLHNLVVGFPCLPVEFDVELPERMRIQNRSKPSINTETLKSIAASMMLESSSSGQPDDLNMNPPKAKIKAISAFALTPWRDGRAVERAQSDGHLKQSLNFVQISLRLADERGKIVRCQFE
jgi:hypothetical protein